MDGTVYGCVRGTVEEVENGSFLARAKELAETIAALQD